LLPHAGLCGAVAGSKIDECQRLLSAEFIFWDVELGERIGRSLFSGFFLVTRFLFLLFLIEYFLAIHHRVVMALNDGGGVLPHPATVAAWAHILSIPPKQEDCFPLTCTLLLLTRQK
jgi:hypothetical protein